MKVKTSELMGAALDWAVAKCEGVTVMPKMRGGCYVTLDRGETVLLCYSNDWSQGGPIIEREGIQVTPDGFGWNAIVHRNIFNEDGTDAYQSGKTYLIAAMRCYVASKLGDEVDVPDELVKEN